MEKRSEHYYKISDEQKVVLERFFDEGMTSSSSSNMTELRKAAEETSLPVERVKKWIGNKRAALKRKAVHSQNNESNEPKQKKVQLPCSRRGTTSFNVFCGDFFKREECKGKTMAQRNALAAIAWKSLGKEEQEKFKDNSKRAKEIDVNSLEEDQRKKIVNKARLQIMDQLELLSDLGCHSMLITVDTANGQMTGLGSDEGLRFLSVNDDIQLKFRQYLACDRHHFTPQDIQKLFNKKYSEAAGKPSRVPYQKRNFVVHNLPSDIPFQRPYAYGRKQRSQIMEAKDKIRFEIIASDVLEPLGANSTYYTHENVDHEDFKTLSKIVDSDILTTASSTAATEKIDETKINIDFELLEDERLQIQHSPLLSLFDSDALKAIEKNIRHKDDGGVLFPVFSDEDEQKFWLFYSSMSPKQLAEISDNDKIEGFWLDKVSNNNSTGTCKYRLLTNHPDNVDGINIVKSKIGPLYYSKLLPLKKTSVFVMPDSFYNTIINVLKELLFL